MGVTIDAADGRSWRVRRRIAWPGRVRIAHWSDAIGIDIPDDFSPAGMIVWVAVTAVFALVIVLLLPLLFFLIEGFFVLALIALARSAWLVEASTPGPPPDTRAWKVKGWRRSKRAVEEIASELRAGVPAAPREGEPIGPPGLAP